MTTTTVERNEQTLTITTRIDLPKSAFAPMSIPPLGEDFNTAAAVAGLYAGTR